MAYDERYLDDLRAAVRVSEVVERYGKHKLRRAGHEFKAIDDPSFTVVDHKRMYYDHGSSAEGGDVFQYLVAHHGFAFPQAVEEIAKLAGLDDRRFQRSDRRRQRAGANGHDRPRAGEAEPRGDDTVVRLDREKSNRRGGRRGAIEATYDYLSADGSLLYQVVRREGKDFSQRRPDGRGGWLSNLEGIEHTIFNLPDVIADMALPREEQSRWFITEGEKDALKLISWGMFATTNSGGALHFTKAMAHHFEDANDLVILEDDDDAGRRRTAYMAPLLQEYGARVRVLKIADHHPDRPKDVSDWVGGDRDALDKLADALPDWEPPPPEPFKSQFGAKTYLDLAGKATPYAWRIKGLVPMREHMMIMGSSRSGKTFSTLDLAMHVVRGIPFNGRKVVAGAIVYLSYEGQAGFEQRIRGYCAAQGLAPEKLRNFAWWTAPPGLYGDDKAAADIAAEIIAIAGQHFTVPVAAIIIDTHNSATRGSSEIKSDEIGRVLDTYDELSSIVKAPLWIVSHTNSEGKHRGNEQIFNRLETVLYVEKLVEGKGQNAVDRKDAGGRVVRKVTVDKQRDGKDKHGWEFTLAEVDIGVDDDGDRITTYVVDMPRREAGDMGQDETGMTSRTVAPGAYWLRGAEVTFFQSLLKAINTAGIVPPAELNLPRTVPLVTTTKAVGDHYRDAFPIDDESKEGRKTRDSRVKQQIHRARKGLLDSHVIGMARLGSEADTTKAPIWYIWPVRAVIGTGVRWPNSAFTMNRTTETPAPDAEPDLPIPAPDAEIPEDFR